MPETDDVIVKEVEVQDEDVTGATDMTWAPKKYIPQGHCQEP